MGTISNIFGYLLNWLYELLNNYGIAIIVFSFILRIMLIPITVKQQKSMKKSSEMQEQMKAIQNKYKNDPEKLNQETMELYKKEKFNPFSGCFSAILQIIIILSVFWLVSKPLTYMRKVYSDEETKKVMEDYNSRLQNNNDKRTYPEIQIISMIEEDYNKLVEQINNEEENKDNVSEVAESEDNENEKTEDEEEIESLQELIDKKVLLEKLRINMELFGLDLSKVPSQDAKNWKVYIIPVLYVLTTFISIKITNSIQEKNKKEENNEKTENNEQDEAAQSMQEMSKSMSYMMPIMSISIAYIAPLGLALYWLVSNILMIIERIVVEKITQLSEKKK